jgi:hypothetical protein
MRETLKKATETSKPNKEKSPKNLKTTSFSIKKDPNKKIFKASKPTATSRTLKNRI